MNQAPARRLDEKLAALLFASWVVAALVAGVDTLRGHAAQAPAAVAATTSTSVQVASSR